jgi:uncharacterized protein with PQ loop repeat
MNITMILGLTGTVIGLVRALPQLFRVLRSRQAMGVSIDTTLTSAIVSAGWATYGFLTQQPFVTLATGASAAVFFVITLYALKFGRRIKELRIAPIWFFALLVAFFAGKEAGLGMILPVSILVSNIPQIYVAAREENLSDLSLGTWILSMSDGFVWGLYSLVEQDCSIMVFAIFQLVTSGTIVFLKLLKQKKCREVV